MGIEETDDAAAFRAMVSTVDMPPGRLAVTELIAEGKRVRRQRRRRSLGASTGALVLTAGLLIGVSMLRPGRDDGPVAAPGGPGLPAASATTIEPATGPCEIRKLPLPKGMSSGNVNAGSPNGRYLVGFVGSERAQSVPAIWDGTGVRLIPMQGLGEAHDVNDDGLVVGDGQDPKGAFAWAYRDGEMARLPMPPGFSGAEANAVNANGDVAGVLFSPKGSSAVVWRAIPSVADPLTLKPIALGPAGNATAFGISDSGMVVGSVSRGKFTVAFSWDAKGTGKPLPGLPRDADGGADGARGDWAYGHADSGSPPVFDGDKTKLPYAVSGSRRSVLWDLRGPKPVALIDGAIQAVNGQGQAVVVPADGSAWLRGADGSRRALDGAPLNARGGTFALSDDGTRIGGAVDRQPVSWTCPS